MTTFENDSRVMCHIGYITGLSHDSGNERIHWYAPKGASCWLSDEAIELWRDKDYEEILRRGM